MDKVLASPAPRVVNVSSDGHRLSPIRWHDINFSLDEDGKHLEPGVNYNEWSGYGQSKTANVLMAVALSQKLGPKRGLLAFSLHPSVIMGASLASSSGGNWEARRQRLESLDKSLGNMEGWTGLKVKEGDRGVATHVYAAFESSLKDHNGAYLQDAHIANPWVDTVKSWATSTIEAERLWKLSEELVGQEFTYQ